MRTKALSDADCILLLNNVEVVWGKCIVIAQVS